MVAQSLKASLLVISDLDVTMGYWLVWAMR